MDPETLRWAGTLAFSVIGALLVWILRGVTTELRDLREGQRRIVHSMDTRMAMTITALYALQAELHPEARELISRTMDALMRGANAV